MQSVQEDLAKSVEKHLRQIYGQRTMKAWHLPQCLKEATNTALREDFHHDPRLGGFSVESRIEHNDIIGGPFSAGERWTPPFNGRSSYTAIYRNASGVLRSRKATRRLNRLDKRLIQKLLPLHLFLSDEI
jgi:hypothetical protein